MEMTAGDVLERMARSYASFPSYRDTGHVQIRFFSADGTPTQTDDRPFRTAFVRPDRFRFEFRNRDKNQSVHRYIVWAEGSAVRTWWDVRSRPEQVTSLALALAGATGVSGGSAHTVPALLMPDRVSGRRLTELIDLELVGEPEIDGARYFQLTGRMPELSPEVRAAHRAQVVAMSGTEPPEGRRSPTVLWIDQHTLLLRRMEFRTNFDTFYCEQSTRYEPTHGGHVPEDELLFEPPGAG